MRLQYSGITSTGEQFITLIQAINVHLAMLDKSLLVAYSTLVLWRQLTRPHKLYTLEKVLKALSQSAHRNAL